MHVLAKPFYDWNVVKAKIFGYLKYHTKNYQPIFSINISQFSAIYIIIFHKTEVQTVILRCWMGLNLNWYKTYETKRKWGDYY